MQTLLRAQRDIARDAARVSGAAVAQVLVVRDPGGGAPPQVTSAAFDGTALVSRASRDALAALFASAPGHAAAEPLLAPGAPAGARVVAPCEEALVPIAFPGLPEGLAALSVFYRLTGAGPHATLLRLAVVGKLRGSQLRALDAAARLAAGALAAAAGERDAAGRSAVYRAFQESAGEAMFVVDPETGRLLEANAQLAALTGWSPAELRKLSLARLVEHPVVDGPGLLARWGGDRVVRDSEARLRRRRGDPVPVAVTTARVDLHDRAVLHVIARDVSHERRAVAELLKAKETLAALHLAGAHLQNETDEEGVYAVLARELLRLGFHTGVLVPDPDHPPLLRWRFTSFAPPLQRAVERVLGRPLGNLRVDPAQAPLVGRCLVEGRTVFTDRARPAVQDLLGGASATQLRSLGPLFGLRRVLLAPLKREGRPWGVLAVAAPRLARSDPQAIDAFAQQTSIALDKARLFAQLREERARLGVEVDRRTRELQLAVKALEEAGRRKDNFLANVSHELRSPLVPVVGYADLLLGERLGPLAPKQRNALQVLSSSAKRLRRFIEELLEWSRHELTKEHLAFAPFEVADVLQAAALGIAPRLSERGLEVRVRVLRGTPRVWGDRERILQVVTNLLANAVRHSRDGGTIRLAAARVRPGRVEVAVADRGEGIPEDHLPHIFERLYQVRDAAGARSDGLGLGLAIVKSLVEAHGGTVEVRSRVGRGTRFTFSLQSEEAVVREPPPPVPAGRSA
jgi:PAS domain S-box-containing protein